MRVWVRRINFHPTFPLLSMTAPPRISRAPGCRACGWASTSGRRVDMARLDEGRTVVYLYPRTGLPDRPAPEGWDQIPGARGCTPESCGFRDHFRELADLGASVFGLSTQDTDYQREAAERLALPFELLSDSRFELTDALDLPTFVFEGERLLKRLTMIVRDGRIEHVFYPVFPPDAHVEQVLRWLSENGWAKA